MLAPLGKSDHSSILLNLNVSADSHKDFVKSSKMLLGKVTESDILAFAEEIDWSYSSDELFGYLMRKYCGMNLKQSCWMFRVMCLLSF